MDQERTQKSINSVKPESRESAQNSFKSLKHG
jgi:hypothetical protein